MNVEQFYNTVRGAEQLGTLNAAHGQVMQSITEFSASRCVAPIDIKVCNCDDGLTYPLQVGCGKCPTCRSRYRDEWVTRMCLEYEHATKVYFVTLSYKGYENFDDIPPVLYDAFWHFDNQNSTNHTIWSPCLVRLEHFQMFVRHLRNDLRASGRDAKFKVFAGFEYGEKYGRPHIHAVIFRYSGDDLYMTDFERAWSIRKGRKHMTCSLIGDIDVTCNTDFVNPHSVSVNIDGRSQAPKDVFKYVAKYVNKDVVNENLRIKYLRNLMQSGNLDNIQLLSVFNRRIVKRICNKSIYSQFVSKPFNYNDEMFQSNPDFYRLLSQVALQNLAFFDKLFKPFCTMSRAEGIASFYAESNVERMAQGNFKISSSTWSNLVLPHYFVRKVKEYLCGLQFHSKLEDSDSFSAQNRPYIIDGLQEFLYFNVTNSVAEDFICPVQPFLQTVKALSDLLHSKYCFRDSRTGLRYLIFVQDDYIEYDDGYIADMPTCWVGCWRYNRSKRLYEYAGYYDLEQFICLFVSQWSKSKEFSKKVFDKLYNDQFMLDKAIEICDGILQFSESSYIDVYQLSKFNQFNVSSQFEKDKYNKYNKKLF